MRTRYSIVLALVWAAASAQADTIINNPQVVTATGPGYLGESFIMPNGGPWNDIAFAFLTPADAPEASGDLFLLSEAYTGANNALSSATPGFLAESTGTSLGFYDFAASVTLQADTQYFVYMDTAGSPILAAQGTPLTGAGGYLTYVEGASYVSTPVLSFEVTGTPTSATPEPSTIAPTALMGLAILVGFKSRLRMRGPSQCR
jgi:hypothetical protein